MFRITFVLVLAGLMLSLSENRRRRDIDHFRDQFETLSSRIQAVEDLLKSNMAASSGVRDHDRQNLEQALRELKAEGQQQLQQHQALTGQFERLRAERLADETQRKLDREDLISRLKHERGAADIERRQAGETLAQHMLRQDADSPNADTCGLHDRPQPLAQPAAVEEGSPTELRQRPNLNENERRT